MTQNTLLARTSLGAIAALIALSTTPAAAQVADPTSDTPSTTVETTASASDPLAPDTTVSTEAPTADTGTAAPEPTTAASAPVARRTAAPSRSASRANAARPAPTPAAPAAVADAEPSAPSAPVVSPTPEAVEASPLPAVAAEPRSTDDSSPSGDLLPIAGAAGLGVLAILGVGLAMRRRRSDDDIDVRDELEPAYVAAAPTVARESIVQPRQAATTERSAFAWGQRDMDPVVDKPTSSVPSGFDTSRFGRHVQAAYRGPSADNPSLSLKKRLKRASFMDLRERQAGRTDAVKRPSFSTGFEFRKPSLATQ